MENQLLFKIIRFTFSKKPNKRIFCWATVFVIANLLLSCSFNPHYQGVLPEKAQYDAEAPINQILRYGKALRITEAYKDHNLIYLNSKNDDKTVTGFIDLDATDSISIHTDWFRIFQFHLTETTNFKDVAYKSNDVPYLERVLWERFVEGLYDGFVPKDPWKGVVVNYRDREDIVYRDRKGTIHGKDPFQKTSDITLIASLRVEELKSQLFTVLEAFLLGQDIHFRQFLFETGETGPYARPFIYIDLDTHQLIFVSLEPYSFGSMPNNYLAVGGKVGTHYVRSYYLDFFNRPITYFSRLLFFLIDTGWDTSRGAYIKFLRFPNIDNTSIPPLHKVPGMDLDEWEEYLDHRFGKKGSSGKY